LSRERTKVAYIRERERAVKLEYNNSQNLSFDSKRWNLYCAAYFSIFVRKDAIANHTFSISTKGLLHRRVVSAEEVNIHKA
jgi:hypothetical protein